MTLIARVYNTYVLSVLSYVSQFYPPTPDVLAAEKEVLALCLPGPGNWIRQAEAFQLRDWFGFPFQFGSISHVSLGSRLRVIRSEGLDTTSLLTRLSAAYSDAVVRHIPWNDWYYSSVFHHYHAVVLQYDDWGSSIFH